jgi:hypothetical protein
MPKHPISYVFFVSETEYPKLQAACPGDFPEAYEQFCARVNHDIRAAAKTVAIEKVFVSVDQFLAWCARNGVRPTNFSRSRYAIELGDPRQTPPARD